MLMINNPHESQKLMVAEWRTKSEEVTAVAAATRTRTRTKVTATATAVEASVVSAERVPRATYGTAPDRNRSDR